MLCAIPPRAHAMTGPLADTIADVLAVVVLILVPIAGVYLFWKLHVLPEVIAEKRHHPQKDAIKTLCILSLFFGGLLWPIAWLWAYTKPTLYKLAYGTDKHEDFHKESAEHKEPPPAAAQEELARIREQIEQLSKKMGDDAADLESLRKALRKELAQLESRLTVQEQVEKEPG
jgi:CBS domain containing-hemolysin-like protein